MLQKYKKLFGLVASKIQRTKTICLCESQWKDEGWGMKGSKLSKRHNVSSNRSKVILSAAWRLFEKKKLKMAVAFFDQFWWNLNEKDVSSSEFSPHLRNSFILMEGLMMAQIFRFSWQSNMYFHWKCISQNNIAFYLGTCPKDWLKVHVQMDIKHIFIALK